MALQTRSKVRLALALAILAIVAVFVALNMATVEVNLVFAKVEMKLAVLIIAVLCLGFLLGWLFKSLLALRPKGSAKKSADAGNAVSS